MSAVEVRTPGYVLAEMRTVDAAVTSLTRDITAASRSGSVPDFAPAFAEFAAEWVKFFEENASGFGGWWARGTTPILNKTLEFRERAARWRDEFVKRGGVPSSVALPTRSGVPLWPFALGALLAVAAVSYTFGGRHEK